MAKLRKQFLGKVSGKLGDLVFRNTRRTNYISSRPVSFNTPQDEYSINRRSRFAMAGKFSSLIISIPDLKLLWQLQAPAGMNIFNYLVKTNYNLVNPDGLTEIVSLTPPMGWIVNSENVTVNQNDIKITISPIGENSGIRTDLEKEVRLFCVISLSKPADTKLDASILIPLVSEKALLSLTNTLNFELKITNQISELMNKYQTRLLLFALVTYDEEGNPVSYSKTFIG
jgi:hypothetical protein